jgi:hypothetical protein
MIKAAGHHQRIHGKGGKPMTTHTKPMTRKEYMSRNTGETDTYSIHRQYYAQFVTDTVLDKVSKEIGLPRILASTDKHLNDIPLKEWDALAGFHGGPNVTAQDIQNWHRLNPWLLLHIGRIKKANDREYKGGVSLSDCVCVAKEAATQLQGRDTTKEA